MKNKNYKTLILTVTICLLPMVLGGVLYNKLPDQMPIHFTINDQPDNYAPKEVALFGIPVLMAIVQTICILFTMKTQRKEENKPKIIKIFEWFIPIITVLLYIIMIEVPLGSTVYIGKSVCLILGTLLIIIGNYTPKVSYETRKRIIPPTSKE